MDNQKLICERLKKFGYASERRIRLYGEDLQLEIARAGKHYRNRGGGQQRGARRPRRKGSCQCF